MKYTFGFIGTGNMGGAVAKAVCCSAGGKQILLCNRTPEKAQALAEQLGCAVGDARQVVQECDFVFLGVKPQGMAALLAELQPLLQQHKPVLVSMAAGLTASQIEQMAGGGLPVMRIMPNTPVGIGCGVITILIRYFGGYNEGVSYAILVMNCCVVLLDKVGKPTKYGAPRKEGSKA